MSCWHVWKEVWCNSYVMISFTWIFKGVQSFSISSFVFSCVLMLISLMLAFYFACQRVIFHKHWKTDQEEEGATTFQMLGYSGMPIDISADAVAWCENTLPLRSLPRVYLHTQYSEKNQNIFLAWVLTEIVLLADSALQNQFLLWKLGANIGFCVMRAYVLH